MEAYETARIDVIKIEEDVIAASVEDCVEVWASDHTSLDDERLVGWDVYYTDGSNEYIDGEDKPGICP